MTSGWYDRRGNEITVEEWYHLHERGLDPDNHYGGNSYVRVGEDVVRGVTISTVWLGIDHSFGVSHQPMIFETMIFGGEYDCAQMRYPTEEEAVRGHREAVVDVTAGMQPWWSWLGDDDEDWPDAWVMRVDRIADEIT